MKAYCYKTHTNGSENQRMISPSDRHILTVAAHDDLQVEGFTLPVPKKSTMTVDKMITPRKTNMEPQDWWFVDASPLPRGLFQVLC